MIFPLPLTSFEEYMLADDRPSRPMTFFLRLELDGQFNQAALAAALNSTLARHPLLSSLLAEDKRGRRQWIAADRIAPATNCSDGTAPLEFPDGLQIDLRRDVGLRTWVRTSDAKQWTLWLQFHHACCDGLAAIRLAGEVLTAYRNFGINSPTNECQSLDPERLRRRASFGLTPIRRLLRLPQELLGLLGIVEFFSHSPPSLTCPEDAPATTNENGSAARMPGTPSDNQPSQPYPRWVNYCFSPADSERLRQTARDQGVTVNDLLLASVFLAVDEWFGVHRPEARRQFVRVMVPVNLRSTADLHTPAANIVSMVNLDRRPSRYSSYRRLLKSVSLEMAIIKRCRLGITMHHLVGLARRFGKLSRLLPDDRCLSTCVLSNLGEVTALLDSATADPDGDGSLGLVSLDFLPPLRPLTEAAFGVSTLGGRTSITLHVDSRAAADFEHELLGRLVRRLKEFCGDQFPPRNAAIDGIPNPGRQSVPAG